MYLYFNKSTDFYIPHLLRTSVQVQNGHTMVNNNNKALFIYDNLVITYHLKWAIINVNVILV